MKQEIKVKVEFDEGYEKRFTEAVLKAYAKKRQRNDSGYIRNTDSRGSVHASLNAN